MGSASGESSRVRVYSTMSLFQSWLRITTRAAKSPPTVTPASTRARRRTGRAAARDHNFDAPKPTSHAHRRQIEVAFGENVLPHPVGVENGRQRGKEPQDGEGSEAYVSFAAAPAGQEKGSEHKEGQQAGQNAKIEQARAGVEDVKGAEPYGPEELPDVLADQRDGGEHYLQRGDLAKLFFRRQRSQKVNAE